MNGGVLWGGQGPEGAVAPYMDGRVHKLDWFEFRGNRFNESHNLLKGLHELILCGCNRHERSTHTGVRIS